MKLSSYHLRSWVDFNEDSVAHTLTMLGHEVDDVITYQAQFSDVVVGLVISRKPHPNADKLSICEVDVGQESTLQIVCGAKNVDGGQKVPVALVGAVLPGDFTIKQAKLRGELSQGMICAANELAIDFPHDDGIWVLSSEAPVGQSLVEYLPIDDVIFDLALTPNRADCFSTLGLARDLAAKDNSILKSQLDSHKEILPNLQRRVSIESSAVNRAVFSEFDCLIQGRVTPTPVAMLLHRLGYTLINPICDAIHLVMHSLGQPLHAYDANALSNDARIMMSEHSGENEFLGLDQKKHALIQGDLVVRQGNEILGLAGIMGSDASKSLSDSTSILLEAASFSPESIAKTSRRLKFSSDSSMRFERGVDPNMPELASAAVMRHLRSWGMVEGECRQHMIENAHIQDVLKPQINISCHAFERRLGYTLPAEDMQAILARLGCTVDANGDTLQVSAPSWRYDLEIEADLIEEIARIHGYDAIPTTTLRAKAITPALSIAEQLCEQLVKLGFNQAVTLSLRGAEDHAHLKQGMPVSLTNPIAEPLSTLRSSLVPGLLNSLDYNFSRGVESHHLFESGHVYQQLEGKRSADHRLAGVFYGISPLFWRSGSDEHDFYYLKGLVMHLLESIMDTSQLVVKRTQHTLLHPGQSCAIFQGETLLAQLGKRHPKGLHPKKHARDCYLFEIQLGNIDTTIKKPLESVSLYPKVQRDLCFWLSKSIDFGLIQQDILEISPSCLKDITLFDIYKGSDEPDLVSYTLRFQFESSESTLEEQVIQQQIDNIISLLQKKYNIIMR